MKAKTKFLIFPIFLGLILGIILIPNNVNAISYYNHIQNPSFITYSDYIEDGGFESGSFDSGIVYGNWSQSQSIAEISLNSPHSGVYNLWLHSEGTGRPSAIYNLTESYYVLGADIVEFSFYYKYGSRTCDVWIHYSDFSSDSDTIEINAGYEKEDFTYLINDAKYVVAIEFWHTSSEDYPDSYIDDVVLLVDDGGGQDSLGQYTTPWYRETKNPLYTVSSLDMEIISTFGRLDSFSVYSKSYHKAYLRQSIYYLATSYVHFVSGYFYSERGSEIGIRCIIAYTDGTSSSKIENISADSTWEYVNFGKSFINSNKYINKISFDVYSYISDTVYFDDVGLWASVEFDYIRFNYNLLPYPIAVSYTSFHAYQQVQYIMSCYLYNASGGLSENGTYQFSDNTGFTTGDFEDGIFSYVLTKRVSTRNFEEGITVTVILAEEVINFQITATWQYVEADVDVPDVDVDSNLILNFFMYGIFFLAIPLTVSVYVGGATNPSLGITTFVGAETLMGAIGLSIGLIDVWFMIVIIIADVLLIFTMIRNR